MGILFSLCDYKPNHLLTKPLTTDIDIIHTSKQ